MSNLSTDQRKAVEYFREFIRSDDVHKFILTGGPGTGKSFLTKYLLELAEEVTPNIYLTASTNKAATVLSEMAGKEVKTIHSLLGLRPFNNLQTGKKNLKKTSKSQIIKNAILFIDEFSFIDKLLLKFINELTLDCKIIFIGDDHQLAPIGSTNCPVSLQIENQVKLTTPHRQASNNTIIPYAYKFRQAIDSEIFPRIESQLPNIKLVDGPEFQATIDTYFEDNSTLNVNKILAYTNARVIQYNSYIHEYVTGTNEPQVGDVMVANDPIIVGGDVLYPTDGTATITSINKSQCEGINGYNVQLDGRAQIVFLPANNDKAKQLIKNSARAKNWSEYFRLKEKFADLRHTYASTVHKSQGSTYKNVFIDIENIGSSKSKDQIARMCYVAITRATDNVFLFGDLPGRLY